jgi:hypothetical protein
LDRTSQGAIQAGPKRKRILSNRNKTGRLTCRRKKCDEGQPYCKSTPSPLSPPLKKKKKKIKEKRFDL